MKPDVVVDVGNSRIKWGRCAAGAVAEVAGLPPDDPAAWERQAEAWGLPADAAWLVSGVHPARRGRLADWLRGRGARVRVLEYARELPLRVALDHPDRVGIDRLLNAVAANARRRPDTAAALVDAGSAITVDYLDAGGAFRGGAILPGLRLMARALHDHTALLPLVEVREAAPALGASTSAALHAGIFWAALGGVEALLRELRALAGGELDVFFAGGDAALLASRTKESVLVWTEMTLEGLRLAAAALAG